MRFAILTLFAVWLVGGIAVIALRFYRPWHGRRTCTQWLCPTCHETFGGTVREWRCKPGVVIKSSLFRGAVLYCSRCRQDFWFTWSRHHLSSDFVAHLFEIYGRAA